MPGRLRFNVARKQPEWGRSQRPKQAPAWGDLAMGSQSGTLGAAPRGRAIGVSRKDAAPSRDLQAGIACGLRRKPHAAQVASRK